MNLAALNNVNIEAAANDRIESHFRQEKKSGWLGSGGVAIAIGIQNKALTAMV